MIRSDKTGLFLALAAPVLFGMGTALSKDALAGVHPVLMAGLLYIAAGAGLALWRWARPSKEVSLTIADWPRAGAVTLCGGIIAPSLLMFGLARWPASSTSLILNLEAPLTAILAWAIFREHVGRRTAIGIALVVTGCAVLSGAPDQGHGFWGAAATFAAAFFWALDNNLTQGLSGRDPVHVAAVKGLVAGAFNITAGALMGARLPSGGKLIWIAVIGFLSYGVSLTCYMGSLRRIGSARTAMYFALAPFVGAAVSLLALKEPMTLSLGIAAILMGLGVWVSARERHEHEHRHGEEHEHLHVHDEHHRHHAEYPDDPHSHRHSHEGLRHAHPHAPDIHHRH